MYDIPRIGRPIDLTEFDVFETLDNLLLASRSLQGFTDNRKRVMAVFDRHEPDHGGKMLGFGKGRTAEEAMVRAVYTTTLPRPHEGGPYITADDFPESVHSHITPDLRDRSLFDYIVQRGDFSLRIKRGKYVARSNHGAGEIGLLPKEAEGSDPLDAIEALGEEYYFFGMSEEIERLPLTLFSQPIEEDGNGHNGNGNGGQGA